MEYKKYYEWCSVIAKALEEDEVFKKNFKEVIEGILPLMREVVK